MKVKKKLITMLMIGAMILSACIPAIGAVSDTGFTDVDGNAWYADAVKYCIDNGLINGISDVEFEPDRLVSRDMFITVLNQKTGNPENVSNNEPNNIITREQAATILWRNAGSPASNGTENYFTDQLLISNDATDAVAWAKENKIMNGKENNLFAPDALLTRAESAVIFQNYFTMFPAAEFPVAENTNNDTTNNNSVMEETSITITIDDVVIPAVLNNSVSAQDFIARMPFTVSMTRGTADFYASLEEPFQYDESDVHNGWKNGDIGFDYGGNYLTIFHSGEDTSEEYENQITLGHISDLSLLSNLGTSVQATFALANTQTDIAQEEREVTEHNALVVYFSHTQRTQRVAELLSEKVNGELYEIVPTEPYTGTDSAISDRAIEEIESGNLPELSGNLPDISQYDTIFIGGPVWSDTVSAPILSYLASTDFNGKRVIPFSTDQGTHSSYEIDFTEALNDAQEVIELFPISHVSSISEEEMSILLDEWLETVYINNER